MSTKSSLSDASRAIQNSVLQLVGKLLQISPLQHRVSGRIRADKNKKRPNFTMLLHGGRQGEVIGQYFIKGQEIYVEGRLETRSWDDKETGKKMYRTEIIWKSLNLAQSHQVAVKVVAIAANTNSSLDQRHAQQRKKRKKKRSPRSIWMTNKKSALRMSLFRDPAQRHCAR